MRFFGYFLLLFIVATSLHGMQMEPDTVTFISSDGKEFTIPREIAKQAQHYKYMIIFKEIDLPIPSDILDEIAQLMQMLYNNKNLTYDQLIEKAKKEISIKNNYLFAAAVKNLDFQPGIDLISDKYADLRDYSLPRDDYEHYMKLIRELNLHAYEKFRMCEKTIGKPCIEIALDKKVEGIKPGRDRTQGYPIMLIDPAIKFYDDQKTALNIYLQSYMRAQVIFPIPITEDERKDIMQILKDIAPDLYQLIILVDPSGKEHIKRASLKGAHAHIEASLTDGLPQIYVTSRLKDLPKNEKVFVIAHELGHYVLGHLFKHSLEPKILQKITTRELKMAKKVSGQLPFGETFRHSFSRIKELEADRFAVIELGRPIDDAIAFAKTSEAEECWLLLNPEKETFKSTHPLWAARIKQFEDLRREVELNRQRSINPKPINWKELAAEYLKEKITQVNYWL